MNNKIFFVNKSEIEGRLDSEYYRPDISEIEAIIRQKSTKNLAHFAYFMASGGTPSVTEKSHYSDKENGIPFLRVQNLTEQGVLNLDGLKYISKDVHENMLKRSQFDDQDLLVKITGVGRMAVASVPPLGFMGNTNQHMIVVKTKNRQTSEYLANYLNLDIVEKLAKRRSTGGTRPALDYTALRSIPIIENLDFSKWDNAKMQAQNIQNQAQTLLSSISDYLLEQLGIVVPNVDNALNNRIFFVNANDVRGGRLDCYPKQIRFKRLIENIKQSKFPIISLKNLVLDIKNGVEIRDYDETGFRYLRVTDLSFHNINNSNPRFVNVQNIPKKIKLNKNCILVARSGSLGLVNIVTNELLNAILSSHIFKIELNTKKILPEFLEAYMRSEIGQWQFKILNNGGVIPEINQSALGSFLVCIPDLPTQKSIVQHINQIRQQAQALEQEAIDLLKQAQDDIETMILIQ